MGNIERQGCFAVRFVRGKYGGIVAELTGEHWPAEALCFAEGDIRGSNAQAMIKGMSPKYLVPERVVKAASCVDDPELAPQMLLYAASQYLPKRDEGGLADRIVHGVMSTIGGSIMLDAYGGPLTDEEIDGVFSAFGVERKNNETYSHDA